MPELDPPAAAAFLTERTGDPDRDSAAVLAEQLGCLPLGLEQAGAYIAATPGAGLASYLASYRRRRPELHRRGEPADYDDRIATTWNLALQTLDPAAAGLLRLLACYAPDNIPLTLLLPAGINVEGLDPEPGRILRQLADDELELEEALTALYRYSLIRPGTPPTDQREPRSGTGGQGRLVSVHRLVQAVVLDQLPDPQQASWAQAASVLLDRALPDDPEDPVNWPAFTLLLPHLLAIHTGTDLWRAGRTLYVSGDYRSLPWEVMSQTGVLQRLVARMPKDGT